VTVAYLISALLTIAAVLCLLYAAQLHLELHPQICFVETGMMPGAPEHLIDKFPRGQKVAKKNPRVLLGCERGGNAAQRRKAHRAALARLGEKALAYVANQEPRKDSL